MTRKIPEPGLSMLSRECNVTLNKKSTPPSKVEIIRNIIGKDACKIGHNCTIQSGVTMGFDDFAYERLPDGQLEKFPHLKGVVIGDNVEISPNCLAAKGSLSDTEIGNGTKLDAAVYVAHNVKIGRNCLLTGGARIGGTVRICDQCWIGLNYTIKQKVRIGNNVIIGAGSVVLHDVSYGDIVAGVPAKSIKHKVTTDKLFMMSGQDKK